MHVSFAVASFRPTPAGEPISCAMLTPPALPTPNPRRAPDPPGRQYARNSLYIDVMGIPSISKAVQAASEMLRAGIIRAMSTPVEDPSAQPRAAPQKRDPADPPKGPAAQAQQSGSRDPASVYLAVTKRARKAPPPDAPPDEPSSPVIIVREKMTVDPVGPPPAARAWNGAKKVGPSILAKRARPPSMDPGAAPAPERVFQPAAKRERRVDAEPKTVSAAASKAAAREPEAVRHASTSVVAKPTASQPAAAEAESRPPKPSAAAAASPATDNAKRLLSARADAGKVQAKLRSELGRVQTKFVPGTKSESSDSKVRLLLQAPRRDLRPGARQVASVLASRPPAAKALLAKESNRGSGNRGLPELPSVGPLKTMKLKESSKPAGTGAVRSPTSRMLPPAWSQVNSKGFKSIGSQDSRPKTILRKPAAKPASSSSLLARTTDGPLSIAALRNAAPKGERVPSAPPRLAASSSEPMMPLPSAGEMRVKYVPGSEVINGVRPNGYTVSRQGIVKPVVTFTARQKLPHKLRQVSVERLFEVLRDVKKVSEANALSQALETEQKTYANAKGRVDYRAAMTGMLRESRK